MDGPPRAGSTARALQAQGLETERTSAIPRRAGAGDPGRGHPGKPVGAVVAAAKVLRTLHASERPLNASEVARAAGLHRGTAYNILRTLYAEGFVGYDEATRSYAVSLHILELAYGVLRRSGLMDLARPLMHAVSDAHGVSVYLSKVLGPSSLLLLDWVGAAFRTDLYVTVGRQYPGPAGASGVIMAAFGSGTEAELEALFSRGRLVPQAVLRRFSGARQRGEAIRLRGGSRHDVSGHHASVGAGPVAVMGAAAGPDRRRTCARHRRRRRRAAEPRDAIRGGAAFRERAIAASRVISSITRLRGRQHGWIASGSQRHFN